MADYNDLLTERKTMEACLYKTTFDLLNLQKIKVSLRSDDMKQSIEDLLEEKANYLLMLQTLGESIAATQPPQVVNPIAVGGSSKTKDLKFPSGLVYFDAEKTILPEWLSHTHRVLVTANFDFRFRVNVLMHQVSKDKDVFEWVGTNIVDTGLDWKDAEAAFCDKYGTVCVEEIALDKLWALKYTDFLSTTAFLSSIAACCKGAGVAHDQFLFVSFALQFMNPAVSSLVRFSKQPGKKLSWVELLASVRDQEHNIRIGVVAPNFNPNFNPSRDGKTRREKDKSRLRPDPTPSASTDGDAKLKVDLKLADWKLTKTCHTCGVKGHISPECPQMEGKASTADPPKPPVLPKPPAVHRPQLLVAAGSVEPPCALTDDAVDAALREMCGLPVVGQLMVHVEPSTDGPSHSGSDVDLPPPLPPGDLLRVPCEVNGRQIWAVVDCAASKTSLSSTFIASFPSGFDFSLTDPQPVLLQFGNGATTLAGRYLRLDRFRFGDRDLRNACCYEATFPSVLGGVDQILWIGLDFFPSLGLSVHGLPVTFPAPVVPPAASDDGYHIDATDSDGSSASAYTDTLWKDEDKIPQADHAVLLHAISDVLETNAALPVGSFCCHPDAVVRIHLRDPDQRPVFRPQYPVSKIAEPFVDQQVANWDRDGVTEPAPSGMDKGGWNSPLYPAFKHLPDGTKSPEPRVCADLRGINEVSEDFDHRVPDILALFLMLQGFLFASALDLTKSFHQFLIHPDDRYMTAFTWKGLRRQFKGAPFGLKTVTAVFQAVMEAIFAGIVFVIIFCDDILVFTKTTLADHARHVRTVVSLLNTYRLRLNLKKCRFGYVKLRVLGHILTGCQRMADSDKIQAIQDWPEPHSGKDIERLLGFLNYLRDYIPLYAAIAAPLEGLRKLKVLGDRWTPECVAAVATFRSVLAEQVVITFPDYAHEFILAVDASQYGLGLVLYQVVDGVRVYVLFASKSLNRAQRNYSATKRELLAIIFALQRCRQYLYGFRFQLHTDHEALTFLLTQKHTSFMLEAWFDVLLDFTFEIVHCPGVLNVLPDALSRCFGSTLPIASMLLRAVTSGEGASNVVRNLNAFVAERIGKIVPSVPEQAELLATAHAKGHFGIEYIFNAIWHSGFYWIGLRDQIAALVDGCLECLKYNIGKSGFHPARSLHSDLPFDSCAMDTAGPFPTTPRGYNYFFVYVCLCTRFVLLVPLQTVSAAEVAWELWKIFCTFPLPKSLISDNGSQFVNKVLKALAGLMGVDHALIAPYNPAANGLAERMVGLTKLVLSKICNGNFANFDLFLPSVQLHINTKISLLTKTTPMTYVFARDQNSFADYSRAESRLLSEPELADRATLVRDVVFPTLAGAVANRQEQKRAALDDSRLVVSAPIAAGSSVMVKDVTRSKSGAPYFTGPFVVLRCTSAKTYTLLTPDGALFHRNVPLQDLKVISSKPVVDLADLSSLDRTYLIERVIDHRGPPSKYEFLVKWKGYEEKTWEPYANFSGVGEDALRDYWDSRRAVPVRSSVAAVPVAAADSVVVAAVVAPVVVDGDPLPAVSPVADVSPAVAVTVAPVVATRVGRHIKAPVPFDRR